MKTTLIIKRFKAGQELSQNSGKVVFKKECKNREKAEAELMRFIKGISCTFVEAIGEMVYFTGGEEGKGYVYTADYDDVLADISLLSLN